ncbi:TadE family protein [Actinocorallia sp. B10E7]|uniref:TadE family protein n=1 Tax=Actinocorallia sp. B10E7 TaxID=3153558 RepID=UPI00325C742F
MTAPEHTGPLRGGEARPAEREAGAAAVEFALVLPMLLVVVFGMIDTGLWLNQKITATNAARQGLRAYLLTEGGPAAKAEAGRGVIGRLVGRDLPPGAVRFTPCAPAGESGLRTASVSFAYESEAAIGFIPGLDTLEIGGRAEAPCED